jgi:hypothetical protein
MVHFPVQTLKQKKANIPVPKTIRQRKTILLLFYLGLQQIGLGLLTVGKAICFTTNSNVNLIQTLFIDMPRNKV